MSTSSALPDFPPDDPVYLHTRREFLLILGVWVACLLWVVPYCYFNGYQPVESPADLKLVLGMPSWVVWGIGVPWLLADLASIVICVWVIKDDDLEPSRPAAD